MTTNRIDAIIDSFVALGIDVGIARAARPNLEVRSAAELNEITRETEAVRQRGPLLRQERRAALFPST